MIVTGAKLLVQCLERLGVRRVFGIPGAKIDAVFDALVDSPIQLIVCRHEQNAAFMAAMHGRLTGEPGVVLVTSGPGIANLATGLLTATTEGDPIIAIGGNVAKEMLHRASHQSANNAKIMEAVTKFSQEVVSSKAIAETVFNAYRCAVSRMRGASFISIPQDVLAEEVSTDSCFLGDACLENLRQSGRVAQDLVKVAAEKITKAKKPVLLLGQESSCKENAEAVRALLAKHPLPVISTYQAAGVVSRDLEHLFVGRVGLFSNQPGDVLLNESDLIISVGFNTVEYDPEVWHQKNAQPIIDINYQYPEFRGSYQPEIELSGDVCKTLELLTEALEQKDSPPNIGKAKELHLALYEEIEQGKDKEGERIHPLRFIYELRKAIDDETIVTCDIGSVYMWMARYFLSYNPHHLHFSNGQQTLGVSLPWALSTSLLYPEKKIISLSGDGGFLFSATELETAVREGANFIHFIWRDGTYNMVLEQEIMKYQRESGVRFGKLDVVSFARAFGATGFNLEKASEIASLIKEAQTIKGPVLVNVEIDYSDNPKLFAATNPYGGH